RARQHERDVEHANMAAALASDLKVGDACPVCGEPLEHLPVAPPAEELVEAARARKSAEKTAAAAQQAVVAAEKDIERIKRDGEEDERAGARLATELSTSGSELTSLEQEVGKALRGPLPEDAAAELQKRIVALTIFSRCEETAATAHT